MKTFTVNVQVVFNARVVLKAENYDDAKRIVSENVSIKGELMEGAADIEDYEYCSFGSSKEVY